MSERKNNSFYATGFINAEIKERQAGEHLIVTSRVAILSRKKEKKFYIDIEAWNEVAEKLLEAGEGARIQINDGYFTTDSWEDKTTKEKRWKNFLTIDDVEIISTESEGAEKAPAKAAPQKSGYQKGGYAKGGVQKSQGGSGYKKGSAQDDIPF